MYFYRISVFAFVFIMEYHETKEETEQNVNEPLAKLATNDSIRPTENPFLNNFLESHFRPSVNYEESNFYLNIVPQYQFKPPIERAPFSSTGEPWPKPKDLKSEKGSLLNLNPKTFKITLLDDFNCDILIKAVRRYDSIVKKLTIEEHYDFVYNYDENLYGYWKHEEEAKYMNIKPMVDLQIEVTESQCGYPNVGMDESYQLNVTLASTRLVAKQVWGALRGLETFSQLLFRRRGTDQIYARVTEIYDEPRFPHRGILMDTSRHYMHMYTIYNVLDGMSYNKMNVLHWHIVDDNSFPYQSLVFPKLSEKPVITTYTTMVSYQSSRLFNVDFPPHVEKLPAPCGRGAFHPTLIYTQQNIKDFVDYARLRGIRVVPEFDSPGHTFSWLGYPDIKSTCYVDNQPLKGPVGPINPAQNKTYSFMAELFGEIYQAFPDSFVHLGGDELHSTCWATNPSITAYLEEYGNIPASEAAENAGDYVNKAIGYYFKRLIATLKTTAKQQEANKSFIMWEDVLKNTQDVPKDSVLQVWTGQPDNVKSLNAQGYRALYSSCWYLDNYVRKPMWVDYYACEPSPYETEDEEKDKLLGGEACLWAESITTDTLMTFMWPRASAPAERLWSPRSTTNIADAMRRIQEQRCRMIYRGLPTGHISGSDYCLRPRNGLQGVLDDTSYSQNGQQYEGIIRLIMHTRYQRYLPLVNILLSLAGVYLLIIATKCCRKGTTEYAMLLKSPVKVR